MNVRARRMSIMDWKPVKTECRCVSCATPVAILAPRCECCHEPQCPTCIVYGPGADECVECLMGRESVMAVNNETL